MFHLPMSGLFGRGRKDVAEDRTADQGERSYQRFTVPGAQAGIRVMKKKGFRRVLGEMEYFPLSDISRGGLRFASNCLFRANAPVEATIYLPEQAPIELKAKVRWFGVYPGISYTYHIGLQFLPFAEQADAQHNDVESYRRLAKLEKIHGDPELAGAEAEANQKGAFVPA